MEVDIVHGYRVARLGETTSTNTVVAGEARHGAAEGLVVTADYQSAGRGRFDRRWEAPPGTALLFSVLLRPRTGLALERRHLVVAAVSLAAARAAEEVAAVSLSLKWPNDLLAPDGRKVAGVLAEVVDEAVVVGLGLNVSAAPEGATCLEALAGCPVERDELLDATLAALAGLCGRWDDVAALYRERLSTIGKDVVVHLTSGLAEIRGTAMDVDDAGRLLVRTSDGLVEVAAGDVEHATRAPQCGYGERGVAAP